MTILTGKAMNAERKLKPINIQVCTNGWFGDDLVLSDDIKYVPISYVAIDKKDCIEIIDW